MAELLDGLWPWSGASGPRASGVEGRGSVAGPGAAKRHGCMGAFVIQGSAPRAGRGGSVLSPRTSAPLGAPGGAEWGGGRREGGGGNGKARTALFTAAACAGRARISHFSERGLEARWAPPSPRQLPARLFAPGAPLPPLLQAPRVPRGRQRWISGAVSFIRKLLTKWKVNYGCPDDPARGRARLLAAGSRLPCTLSSPHLLSHCGP